MSGVFMHLACSACLDKKPFKDMQKLRCAARDV